MKIRNKTIYKHLLPLYFTGEEKLLGLLPDDLFLKAKYRIGYHRNPDLRNPSLYSEKLQWYKLYYRPEILHVLADKISARKYAAERIGADNTIPVIGVWDDPESIRIDTLPEKFVLKCNHDSGSAIICKNKKDFDFRYAKDLLKIRLRRNYYIHNREWAYKDIKPEIIAEPYLEDSEGRPPKEYKVFCFDGHAEWIAFCSGTAHSDDRTKDLYDRDLNLLKIRMSHPNSKEPLQKIDCPPEIIRYAETLAQDLPHVRADFYAVDEKIYFGELTFYPDGGFVHFSPPEWDKIFGNRLRLPYPLSGINK